MQFPPKLSSLCPDRNPAFWKPPVVIQQHSGIGWQTTWLVSDAVTAVTTEVSTPAHQARTIAVSGC